MGGRIIFGNVRICGDQGRINGFDKITRRVERSQYLRFFEGIDEVMLPDRVALNLNGIGFGVGTGAIASYLLNVFL